jgi:putative membrane protein
MHSLPSPSSWNFDPLLLVIGALFLAGYFGAITRLGPRYSEEKVSRRRVLYLLIGVISFWLAVITPLDTLGRYYLLSAHTLQLLILTTITAPFLLLGLPEWLVTCLLPLRVLRESTQGILFPVLAALAFNAIIMFWHDGPLFEQAAQSTAVHNLQMLCFLLAGVLTWWPLLSPLNRRASMTTPFQMLYLGLESLPLDIFGVIMIFSGNVFYATYVTAPRIWGVSALVDQQIAGGLLAVPGNLLDIVLFSLIFFTWIGRQEDEQRALERELYAEEDAAALAASRELKPSGDGRGEPSGSTSEALPG